MMSLQMFESVKASYNQIIQSCSFPVFAANHGIKLALLEGVAPLIVESDPGALQMCPVLDDYLASGMAVCEAGCGVGAIACYAAKRGCQVTALDVTANAVLNTRINAWANGVDVDCHVSDLFSNPKVKKQYDRIIFNMPWFDLPVGTDYLDVAMADENYQVFSRFCREAVLAIKDDEKSMILIYFSEHVGNMDNLITTAARNECRIQKVKEFSLKVGEKTWLACGLYQIVMNKTN